MINRVPEPPYETRSGPFVSATAPAIGRIENEDMIGILGTHTAWVLDGADDPLADEDECPHGARWYVRALHEALAQSLSENQSTLSFSLQVAIQRARDLHEAECKNPSHRKPSATVCILRCGPDSIDYLVLGDASILLESSDAVIHVTDRRLHRIGQDVRHTIHDRLQHGHGYDDPLRPKLLRELLLREQRARNTTAGYSIAAYEPATAFDSVIETLPLNTSEQAIDRAALLTDGAERAFSLFGLYSDWRHFMKVAFEEGPAECIKGIRKAEQLDRLGEHYPRTKYSDDASIVLWSRTLRL